MSKKCNKRLEPMSFPRFQLRKPIHSLFVTFIETEAGGVSPEVFAYTCIREGIEEIRSLDDFYRAAPIMERQMATEPQGAIYYDSPDNLDEEAKTFLNSKGITSKRSLIREAVLRFLEKRRLIRITENSILL